MGTSEDQGISRQNIGISGYQGESQEKKEIESKVIAGFEKLWVWRKAHMLMLEIYKICCTLPLSERFNKKCQLERSSSSVPDNIAEGYTSYYYQDKIKGFYIARKEAGESQNHLRALQGNKYITEKQANELIGKYEEIIRGINGYINWVRAKRGDKK
ncbi:hypothetical protein A2311_03850 [candidate division WOR-1 bacterium RIFOXYB2_FULL_48_7]|uniref:Four helix bundle protein n=1 Tax=candidate division WOR-1 bacterium RIFOXYB2_FULL_48_7 TaxID=1802583 RepID=A0A1F4T902_UNCSA|nr:MAG: hypothetical protein A2311_03850 [candidate division WOR-1 bacterium RIFOXYB2_FULL_48_7]